MKIIFFKMDKYEEYMRLWQLSKIYPENSEFYVKKMQSYDFKNNNSIMGGLATICAQEFSRKILYWPLRYICTKKTPIPLQPHQYIAGGCILSLLTKTKIKDIDVFLAGDFDINTDNLINLAKICDSQTSLYAITITKLNSKLKEYFKFNNIKPTKIPIQIIKRIYLDPSHIIGGFDLDSCRFIMNHKGEIYCTYSAYYAIMTRNLPINIYCQSRNFSTRIRKYRARGFKPMHFYSLTQKINKTCFTGTYDYFATRTLFRFIQRDLIKKFNKNFGYKDSYLKIQHSFNNLKHILNSNYEFCTVTKDMATLPELLWILDNIYSNDLIAGFYSQPKSHRRNIKSESKYKVELFYKKYIEIQNYFEVKYPISQFTSSFHPTRLTASQIYEHSVKLDLTFIFPEIITIYIGLKSKIRIKNLIIIILIHYFNNIVIQGTK